MTNTPEALQQDIDLIKGLGANAVRCHYPYSEETYDLLDRAGLLAVCEIPLYQWGRPGHSEANLEAATGQLEEMIGTLGNHPSIGFWSVSNETRTRPREPGPEHEKLSEMVVRGNLALIDLAHRLDATRPVIAPSNRWPDDPAFQGTDLNSVNVYIGVEQPHVDSLPALNVAVREQFAALRAAYPNRPILVTEFGSWALRGLMTEYFPGEPYQAELLKTLWEAFEHEQGFAGGFVWVFADSDVHRKFTTIYEMRCAYGLYDLHRRPKAAAETVRQMWAASPGEAGDR
jgi:beta-glucuronidase